MEVRPAPTSSFRMAAPAPREGYMRLDPAALPHGAGVRSFCTAWGCDTGGPRLLWHPATGTEGKVGVGVGGGIRQRLWPFAPGGAPPRSPRGIPSRRCPPPRHSRRDGQQQGGRLLSSLTSEPALPARPPPEPRPGDAPMPRRQQRGYYTAGLAAAGRGRTTAPDGGRPRRDKELQLPACPAARPRPGCPSRRPPPLPCACAL